MYVCIFYALQVRIWATFVYLFFKINVKLINFDYSLIVLWGSMCKLSMYLQPAEHRGGEVQGQQPGWKRRGEEDGKC